MSRILIVSYYDIKSGGTGVSTYCMAKSLKKLGHTVYIASLSVFPGIDTFIFKNFRLLPLFGLRDLYLFQFINRIIKAERIDLVHISDYRFSFVGSQRAAINNNIPCVLHLRDYWFGCLKGDLLFKNKEICGGMEKKKCLKCLPPSRKIWEFYKINYFQKKLDLLRKVDAIVAVSEFVAGKMRKLTGKQIEVIYDFFEKCDNKKDKSDNKLALKYVNKVKVLFAGRLIYHKGISILLDTAKEINTKNKNIVFIVAGDGESRQECEKFIEKNDLGNIELLGQINYGQINSLYDIADIIYYPSILPEPLGRTIIEAMGRGKAVIASDIGGIKEIITDNKNGFLVKAGCVADHVEKILELANDKQKREQIGNKALERSADFLDYKVSARLDGVYKKIVKKNSEDKYQVENKQ